MINHFSIFKRSGRDWKEPLRRYHRYCHWRRQNILFIHVPKAAGTSVNRALYGRTLGHYRAEDLHNWFPKLYRKSFVFSIVRNPWDRILSAYRFAKQAGTSDMGIANPTLYMDKRFDSFERFLKEWLIDIDLSKSDFVFCPQYEFVCNESLDLMVDYVGRVEDIQEAVKIIEENTGKHLSIGHVNRTSVGAKYTDFYTNGEMVDIVAKVYERDVMLFGYDFGQ